MQNIDAVLRALTQQAETDARFYQSRRPVRMSAETLFIDAYEMADFRITGKDDEASALKSCYVLVFQCAVRY